MLCIYHTIHIALAWHISYSIGSILVFADMTKLDRIDHHPSHPGHPLWHKRIETLYKCNGCDQLGFGMCYRCKTKDCNFHLHKECARAGSDAPLNHPFYLKHILLFRCHKPSRVRSCKACGDGVSGFRYKAWHQKADRSSNPFWLIYQHYNQKAFHPRCAALPPSLNGEGRLVLKLNKNKKGTGTCRICNNEKYSRGVKGWAYISNCGKFSYHVACVKRWMEDAWESESLNRSQRWRRIVAMIGKGAARLALELVIEAILGFPPALGVVMSYLFSGKN